ncbi:UNVERIFIED_CONTAM: hypothetical protein RMT77_002674 [Armadillidium vulgare]
MLKSGHRIFASPLKEYEKIYEDFVGRRVGILRLQPGNWCISTPFINYADKIYEFKFKPSDIVIVTFPKCGTTWIQEIVWTMKKNRNLDNPKATIPINFRCPYLELDFFMNHHGLRPLEPGHQIYDTFRALHPDRDPKDGIFLQSAELSEDPRIIKSHLPFSLLPPSLLDTCKVIYLARNPKDVAVSFHHHCRIANTQRFNGNLDSFVEHFINDRLSYSPYWTHLEEGWSKRDHPNLLFCYYEDLNFNPMDQIDKIAKFLNADLTDSQLNNIVNYTSFLAMKERTSFLTKNEEGKEGNNNNHFNTEVIEKEGGFFRKGEVNDWKNKLTKEQICKIDEWTKINCQAFTDDFKYKNF